MARCRVPILACILICFAFAATQAGIETRSGERTFVGVYDPASTFTIGSLSGIFPLDTIQVPVYFSTSRSVTEIVNHIVWNGDDLNLIGVEAGPAVPGGASFISGVSGDTLDYDITVSLEDSFAVSPEDPIAYLSFEVACFGYGDTTEVAFVDQDAYNYYVAGGHTFSPDRESGLVITQSEDNSIYMYVYGDVVFGNTGDADIPMGINLYQLIPGRLTTLRMVIDPQELQLDSISADPQYIQDFTWDTSGDTVTIGIPESNPLLPVNQVVQLFTLHLGLNYCDDGTIDYVDLVYGERKDECGGIKVPWLIKGQVRTPAFTASVDVNEVQCYNTATYYQVPVVMDAGQPINKYELYVDFPSDSLEFDSIVNYGSFTPPGAFVTGEDSSIVKITSGVPTDYQPANLPSRVFYLKFKRRFTPYVGQVFPLTFSTDPSLTNMVQNYSDNCGYYDASALTLENGSITIKRYVPPPPPCPTLYVWDGSSFARENTILSACANGPVKEDVTDYYMLNARPSATEEGLKLEIREDATETSTFSGFRLMAVDHPSVQPVKVTADGRIVTLGAFYGVAWARDNEGRDITELIGVRDGVKYFSDENGWFDVSFGKLKPSEVENFIAALSSSQPKEPPILPKSSGSPGSRPVYEKKLKVFVRTADDSWSLIAEQDPRSEPSIQATVIDPKIIDPGRELVLRYQWEEYYEIDALEFREAHPFEGDVQDLALVGASETKKGGPELKSSGPSDSAPMVLRPGGSIELFFDASALRPIARGTVRDYIFVSKGRYETLADDLETPEIENSLGANYPNPFNPSTQIKYSLKTAGQVDLRIYDVRGALVRTLVSGFQEAGRQTVSWDGTSDSGSKVVSGVYFYQLRTAGFNQTRKMILLR